MRAERLLSIILLLQVRGRMTALELSSELGVSERTIYRDLESLSLSGIAVYGDRGPGGGYALVDGYRTSLTGLTSSEASTLFLSALPQPLADLGLDRALRDALLKLMAALPSQRREQIEQERALLHLDATPWFYSGELVPHLPLLQDATRQQHKVQMTYQYPDGSQSERLISPYGLVAKTTLWYVVADTPNGMRVYRVSRIHAATLTNEPFERPADFDLAEHWAKAIENFTQTLPQYTVRLRLSPRMCDDLPNIYGSHMRERIANATPDADGWRTIPVYFDHIDAARGSIMGLGPDVEVVEPRELRESIATMSAQIAARYQFSVPASLRGRRTSPETG